MKIERLDASDLPRIAEIDRSEHVTLGYTVQGGRLESAAVDWRVPRWPRDPSDPFSVARHIRDWAPLLEEGGVLLGALEEGRLLGFAILRPELEEGVAQLAALFVSRAARRRGIATELTRAVIERARAGGASRLYVSATPSESAVGFYRSQGFALAECVHPELYRLEPEDVHMTREL